MDQRLEAACHSGDLAMLHSLLREDKLLLHRLSITASIDNPLHIAASLGHTDFAEELITRKPDLASELNPGGLSPLHLASAHGHLSIVKHLISKVGSHLCLLKDKGGRLPVHTAATKGRINILEELINACPESARALTYQKESVLHLAVQFNSLETLEYLVEKLGVGTGEINDELLNLKDDKGNTILHHAVARRQIKTVKLLLSKEGVEVNAMNLKGLTALDVLLESPSEHGDLMLGEVIRAANGKVSGEVNHQPSMQSNTTPIPTPTPTDESCSTHIIRSWVRSLFRRRARRTSKKKAEVEDNYTPGQLMVVASLIATITFQSGLNPPGGFTQDESTRNKKCDNILKKAGVAILSCELDEFMFFNMIGLFASLSIIFILICVVPRRKKRMMKILVVIMWVSVFSTALAFSAGINLIFPNSNREKFAFLALGWFCILGIFMSWLCFRFSVYLLRKVRLWRKKERDEESNAVRRGGWLLCCKRIGAVMLILILVLLLFYVFLYIFFFGKLTLSQEKSVFE
ncbi:hypothetical protein J5N97_028835 [Dioscorea zingiberensis]|uniref:PGG domain-containing protein n=1 Tax=Dioscorea zingiberensis TaxID=325984 RepID=A0A9D5C072_9LILI|nr:hypothetical protein J5N97_028835 [Dioscorea zingiberensis]